MKEPIKKRSESINALKEKNEFNTFRKQLEKDLKKLSREEVALFAWRCAVRSLPVLGVNGDFNYWRGNQQKHIQNIFYSVDKAALFDKGVLDTVLSDISLSDTSALVANSYASTDTSVSASVALSASATALSASDAALSVSDAPLTVTLSASAASFSAASIARAASAAGYDYSMFFQLTFEDLKKGLASGQWRLGAELIELVQKNFQKALYENDCGYWAKWYQKIFEKGLVLEEEDKKEINLRLNVPTEIREQGAAAVGRYMEQLKKQGEENLYEARIVIVGEPGSGKTTLFRKLKNENIPVPDPNQKSTHGINIENEISFDHYTKIGQKIKTSVWDFGGQDIQTYLHQYFYSQDNLFILVCDDRKENAQFDYWFEMITRICNEGKIIVVRNLKDRETASQSFDALKYENRFPGLDLKCVDVDLKEKVDYRTLRHTIEKYLSELRIVNDFVPSTWKPVREKILQLEKESKHYISLSRFCEICRKEGIHEEKYQNQCLNYLHRLGYALHYEDIQLINTIFINPKWITAGLYEVLKKDNYQSGNQGRFSKDDIHTVWKENGYDNPTDRNLFLSLLLKDRFDVCYQVEDTGDFLVPLLINHQKKEPTLNETKSYKYRFKFPFMPFGFFSRLIVRLYKKIWNDYVWLSGVWLKVEKVEKVVKVEKVIDNRKVTEEIKDKQYCTAKLEHFEKIIETGDQIIEISLYGAKKDRKELLAEIRTEIIHIKKLLYPNLIIEEQIPCFCEKCSKLLSPYFHNRNELEKMAEQNQFYSQCKESGELIPTGQLLDSIINTEELKKQYKEMGKEGINIDFRPHIEVNPEIKPVFKPVINITNEVTITINNILGEVQNLKEDFEDEKKLLLKHIDEDEYEVVHTQIEKAENAIQEIETSTSEGKPISAKAKSRLAQFISNLTDEKTTLGKCVKSLGNGVDFATKLVGLYNQLPLG